LSHDEIAFCVYILENSAGTFYIGSTSNLDGRLKIHDDPGIAKSGPSRLVWTEQQLARPAAVRRERQIKSMKFARWIREKLLASARHSVDRASPGAPGTGGA
jgi:predicted GIY-YIG superfamily endonuclease